MYKMPYTGNVWVQVAGTKMSSISLGMKNRALVPLYLLRTLGGITSKQLEQGRSVGHLWDISLSLPKHAGQAWHRRRSIGVL